MKDRYRYWRPPSTLRVFGDLIPSRESTTVLLWMRPQLLGWPSNIHWLFLHVFGSLWQLWGIDSAGCLIIVEATIDRDETLKNPFEGLVSYVNTRCDDEEWTVEKLYSRWREYLISQEHADELPPLDSESYRRAVEQAFVLREKADNPIPSFVAMVPSRQSEFCPSDEGLKNQLFLEDLVGSSRVVLRVISGTHGFTGLRIHSWNLRRVGAGDRRWAR